MSDARKAEGTPNSFFTVPPATDHAAGAIAASSGETPAAAKENFAQATLTMPSAEESKIANAKSTAQAAFNNLVPEEYKAKEWVQNIAKTENPIPEFFKSYENAQSLIGSRTTVQPLGPDATPDQVKAFHKAIGVPEDVKLYVVNPTEWAPEEKEIGEFVNQSRSPAIVEHMAKAAQEAGVTPAQLQKLSEAHDRILLKENKDAIAAMHKSIEAGKAQDTDFFEQAKKAFGPRMDVVLANGEKMLRESVPEHVRNQLPKIDNKDAVALFIALDNVHAKYIREGGMTGAGSSVGAVTEDQNTSERRQLYADEAFRNKAHPRHKEVMSKLEANYAQLSRLKGVS